jgi:hypothetical protein
VLLIGKPVPIPAFAGTGFFRKHSKVKPMEPSMLRSLIASGIASVAAFAFVAPASADDAYTTRIEPRAIYGATVTIEEGVRVFRPLPSEHHVIVNPGGLTPLSLGYYDYRYADPRYAPRAYGQGGASGR